MDAAHRRLSKQLYRAPFDEVQPGNGLSLVVDDCVGLNPESAKGFGKFMQGLIRQPSPEAVEAEPVDTVCQGQGVEFVAGGSIRP